MTIGRFEVWNIVGRRMEGCWRGEFVRLKRARKERGKRGCNKPSWCTSGRSE